MKRFGRLALAFGLFIGGLTTSASAQSSADAPFAVQFTVGPTFGNSSGVFFGGELDYRVGTEWELFLELGQMRNVATGSMKDAAQVVVNALAGSSAQVAQQATYINLGVKYLLVPVGSGYQPYIGVGFGGAKLEKDVTFNVAGTDLSEGDLFSQYGVQLGADLAGSSNRPMFSVMGGVSKDFGSAFFDISYRYGAIFANTDLIEDDAMTNTQRLQLGIGVRF